MERTRFEIEYGEGVLEYIGKFPRNIRDRIRDAIEKRLMVAPLEYGKPLTKEWKDHRRIRVGDVRIIYKVFEDVVIVFIVEIDHRKDVYK
ncbi:MAG: type II toxin-antitoxin system RelE family toxin [Rhodanobacter sp.]